MRVEYRIVTLYVFFYVLITPSLSKASIGTSAMQLTIINMIVINDDFLCLILKSITDNQ